MPNPIAMNPQSKGTLGLNDFQRHTEETDKNPLKGLPGLQLPILGLFGEVGSLLSALKKGTGMRNPSSVMRTLL